MDATQASREIKREILSPEQRPGMQQAGWDVAPDEARADALPTRVRRVSLPPATFTPRPSTQQRDLLQILETLSTRLVDNEVSQQH